MIRVDLGRAGGQKSRGKFSKLLGLGGKKKSKKKRTLSSGPFKKLSGKAKAIFIIGLSLALAYLPLLFVEQYKVYIIEQHKMKVAEKNEQIRLLNQEIASLSRLEKELKSYEEQKRTVQAKIDVVRSLSARRGRPVNVLDAVSESLPRDVWLESIGLVASNNPSMSLKGFALQNEDISDYVEKMKKNTNFQTVDLKEVVSSKIDTIEIKKFELSTVPKIESVKSVTPPRETATNAPPAGSIRRRR